MKPNIGFYFSGSGHWAYAAKAAGFKAVFAYEKAQWGEQAFHVNFPDIPQITGLKDVELTFSGEADVIVGSPHCMGFSNANPKATEAYHSNDCSLDFVRAVKAAQPKHFIMEITPRFDSRYPEFYQLWQNAVKDAGYFVGKYKLNAADYGGCQNRTRLYFIGIRKDVAKYDPGFFGNFETRLESKYDNSLTVQRVLCELSSKHNLAIPRVTYRVWRRGLKGQHSHLVKHWQQRRIGTARINHKSHTITTMSYADLIHPTLKRFITVREAAAIMGLPQDFVFPTKSLAKQFKMIGAAVDVRCVTKVLEALKEVAYT